MARRSTRPSRTSPDDPAPPASSLEELAQAAQSCQACPLFENATQAVFGEGPESAHIVLIGEQPGHEETSRAMPS